MDSIAELRSANDLLATADPAVLSDDELGEALVALAREKARLVANEARVTAAFDARKAYGQLDAIAGSEFATALRRIECELFEHDWLDLKERCGSAQLDVPYDQCHVHHIHEYAQGGLTIQENGRLRCSKHNQDRNRPPPTPDEDDPWQSYLLLAEVRERHPSRSR